VTPPAPDESPSGSIRSRLVIQAGFGSQRGERPDNEDYAGSFAEGHACSVVIAAMPTEPVARKAEELVPSLRCAASSNLRYRDASLRIKSPQRLPKSLAGRCAGKPFPVIPGRDCSLHRGRRTRHPACGCSTASTRAGFRSGDLLVSPVRIGRELHDKACAIDAVHHSCGDHLSSMRASGPHQMD
jgi:hypothetical protein